MNILERKGLYPVVFGTKEVRAILQGRKTQMRVPVKFMPDGETIITGGDPVSHDMLRLDDPNVLYACPYGVAGEQLWVKETILFPADEHRSLYVDSSTISTVECEALRFYRADIENLLGMIDTTLSPCYFVVPAAYMPFYASRIRLEITHVRIEVLGDISESDAIAEGHGHAPTVGEHQHNLSDSPVTLFWQDLINKYYEYCWERNCLVWVIEFKRVQSC